MTCRSSEHTTSRRRGRKLSPVWNHAARIVAEYRRHPSARVLAEKYDVAPKTILAILRAQGVPIIRNLRSRGAGRVRPSSRALTNERFAMSLEEICAMFPPMARPVDGCGRLKYDARPGGGTEEGWVGLALAILKG